MHSLRTSSTVWSRLCTYRARGCHRSYWFCSRFPIVLSAFCAGNVNGSTQHSKRAHGCARMTSGGSTPMFRHITRATLTVRICCERIRRRPTRRRATSYPSSHAPFRAIRRPPVDNASGVQMATIGEHLDLLGVIIARAGAAVHIGPPAQRPPFSVIAL